MRAERNNPGSRLLVHYMQPHEPFVNWDKSVTLTKGNFPWEEEGVPGVWPRLKRGELEVSEVVAAYRANLRYVLDDIAILANNTDRETAIITSDHGNGYGEYLIYGHPMHIPFGTLRTVPWASITTENSGEYDPPEQQEGQIAASRGEQLEALGYR